MRKEHNGNYLKVKDLKEILSDLPNDLEIMIQKVGGIGNVANIDSVRKSSYGFFGESIDCLIIDCIGESARRDLSKDEELYIDTSEER